MAKRAALLEVPDGHPINLCFSPSMCLTSEDYYQHQSMHDIAQLGAGRERIRVPIWIADDLDDV